MSSRAIWLPQSILLCGMLLRVLAWVATPYQLANDNHFAPVQIIVEQHRLPRADECWSCYQPPLYYTLAAASLMATQQVAMWFTDDQERLYVAGRKAVQFVSTVAGCATLLVCWLVLRRVPGVAPTEQAIALGFVAFLPRHIHMSAMATNDALAYLMASLAVWAAIRAYESGWRIARVCIAGMLAGAAVLAKAYGLVTALCIVLTIAAWSVNPLRRTSMAARLRPAALAALSATIVGIWPTVFNLANYGRLHVDNFELLPTGLRNQPPGSIKGIDFVSFRLPSLLQHPWSHVSHLNSYWTALYARLWFDSAGTQNTLVISSEWQQHRARISSRTWSPGTARGLALRDYVESDTPADFRRVAVGSYLVGLPLTAAVLAGFALLLLRAHREFMPALLCVHFVGCLAIPLVQTLRLPTISTMKAEFTFNCLTSIPVFVVALLAALGIGWRRGLTIGLALALSGLLILDAAYIYVEYARSGTVFGDVFGG